LALPAGVPLAVCTNCIAPIVRGFYASGMSAESALAAMFASLALIVVVLAMLRPFPRHLLEGSRRSLRHRSSLRRFRWPPHPKPRLILRIGAAFRAVHYWIVFRLQYFFSVVP